MSLHEEQIEHERLRLQIAMLMLRFALRMLTKPLREMTNMEDRMQDALKAADGLLLVVNGQKEMD